MNVISSRPYQEVRDLCHAIKGEVIVSRLGGIMTAARLIAADITYGHCLLVPAPGHEGRAVYTRRLAADMATLSGGRRWVVCNCLASNPHESFCAVKGRGGDIGPIPLEVRFKNKTQRERYEWYRSRGYKVVLVDNVVDTGKTAEACLAVLGTEDIAVVGMTGNHLGGAYAPPPEPPQVREYDCAHWLAIYGDARTAAANRKSVTIENVTAPDGTTLRWRMTVKDPDKEKTENTNREDKP